MAEERNEETELGGARSTELTTMPLDDIERYKLACVLARQYGVLAPEELHNHELWPSGETVVTSIVERLISHYASSRSEVDLAIIVADWCACLAEYPEDLLIRGYRYLLKIHRWNTLPKIADMVAYCQDDYFGRRAELQQAIEWRGRQTYEPMGEEQGGLVQIDPIMERRATAERARRYPDPPDPGRQVNPFAKPSGWTRIPVPDKWLCDKSPP